MAKKESTFINMVLTLLIVALVASSALGYIYELTKEPIRLAKEKKVTDAVKAVLPPFDNLGAPYKLMPTDEKDSLEFFPAFNAEGELVGTAVKSFTNKGFSGYIAIMAGITTDGNISGYAILEHKETPGLGTKMDPWFKSPDNPEKNLKRNILGMNPLANKMIVKKDGGEVDAITAATISSRAFLDAVNRAARTLAEQKGGNDE
ncbi:MAG: RnfABCDGE type electron transport complex subunit G [Bacteroidales bacterium]|nr:RnfABCDGE type electron transport complex subunit G [Bacteroidales bacterium]MCF8458886.1 RnfABCDGE type electron transport complex subunit G [Bacteroidales bacterium]